MSIIRWVGVSLEYTGKLLQQQQIEDWLREAADRMIEQIGKNKGPTGGAPPALTAGESISASTEHGLTQQKEEVVSTAIEQFESEPFQFAVEDAVARLPQALGRFLFWSTTGTGLVPLFAFELAARRHFTSELGEAAEATAAREMIQFGLAADAISALITHFNADKSQPGKADDRRIALPSPGRGGIHLRYLETRFSWRTNFRLGYARVETGDSIAASDQAWREIVSQLGRSSAEYRHRLVDAWTSYIEKQAPGFSHGPLNLGRLRL